MLKLVKEHTAKDELAAKKKLFQVGGSGAGPSSSTQGATSPPKKKKHPKSFASSPDPFPLPPNDPQRDGKTARTAAWPSREPSPKKAKTNGKAKVID